MINYIENCSLRERNTFRIEARAALLVEYDTVEDLQDFIRQQAAQQADEHQRTIPTPILHIGGGSNLLFLNDYSGTILHSRIRDIHVTEEREDSIVVRVSAGTAWDEWVQYAIIHQWYGLENLSLIPGEVGAAAVQNIGAYGLEAKDFIVCVDTVDLRTGDTRQFTAEECQYGYRDSIFKHELRGCYAVTHVHFRLSRTFLPRIEYGGIRKALLEKGIQEDSLTPEQLRQTIIEIRQSKLPDPHVLGNAGSFFTNPIVPRADYERIAARYPDAPHFAVDTDLVKIPAGWMIEQCGWKGRNLGRAGVYEKQALVLVNLGNATGQEVAQLCRTIQQDVEKTFGICIVPEVNFIG